jgi:hypothetical protein
MRGSATLAALALALAAAPPASAQGSSRLPEALTRFDAGDYEATVTILQGLFGSHAVDPVDRTQALRIYGIACVLTGRTLAAEAAFTEWLGLDPRAHLDANLVRPEAVAFFADVRARHRGELVREIERRRPRTAALNLLPPAGQFQNGQRTKFALLLGAELALSALSVATFVALKTTQSPYGTFPDYDRAEALRATNWIGTGALVAVIVYAVIDGFVVFGRIRADLAREEADLRAQAPPSIVSF